MKIRSVPYLILLFSCTNRPEETVPKTANTTTESVRVSEKQVAPAALKIHESNTQILPVDETASDRSLEEFVTELKEIVRKKNLEQLISCLDTGIVVSWGGGMSGIPAFLEEWELNKNPEKSGFWPTMTHYMELGGAWNEENEFRFPYTQCSSRFFSNVDLVELDWYVAAVCISPKTIIYQKPDLSAAKNAILSYEIVRIVNRLDKFLEIQTLDKKITGFVDRRQLIPSADSYPVLEKRNDSWKITSFAPYD